jgi:hypothetical protein
MSGDLTWAEMISSWEQVFQNSKPKELNFYQIAGIAYKETAMALQLPNPLEQSV